MRAGDEEPAIARVDVFERPYGTNELTPANVVLMIVGTRLIARFIAAGRWPGCIGVCIGKQARKVFEPEPGAADLVEIPDHYGMDQEVAKRLTMSGGPGQHSVDAGLIVQRRVERVHFDRLERPFQDEITRHVERVVLFVGHDFVSTSMPPNAASLIGFRSGRM